MAKKMSLGEKLHGAAHAIPGYGIANMMKEKGERMRGEREHIKATRGSPKRSEPDFRHEDHNYSKHPRG